MHAQMYGKHGTKANKHKLSFFSFLFQVFGWRRPVIGHTHGNSTLDKLYSSPLMYARIWGTANTQSLYTSTLKNHQRTPMQVHFRELPFSCLH